MEVERLKGVKHGRNNIVLLDRLFTSKNNSRNGEEIKIERNQTP